MIITRVDVQLNKKDCGRLADYVEFANLNKEEFDELARPLVNDETGRIGSNVMWNFARLHITESVYYLLKTLLSRRTDFIKWYERKEKTIEMYSESPEHCIVLIRDLIAAWENAIKANNN